MSLARFWVASPVPSRTSPFPGSLPTLIWPHICGNWCGRPSPLAPRMLNSDWLAGGSGNRSLGPRKGQHFSETASFERGYGSSCAGRPCGLRCSRGGLSQSHGSHEENPCLGEPGFWVDDRARGKCIDRLVIGNTASARPCTFPACDIHKLSDHVMQPDAGPEPGSDLRNQAGGQVAFEILPPGRGLLRLVARRRGIRGRTARPAPCSRYPPTARLVFSRSGRVASS
jgi:hypothetical protein